MSKPTEIAPAVKIADTRFDNLDGQTRQTVAVVPTQVRRPWRSTLRTIFQAAIALAAMWAVVVQALDLPDWAWVSASLAVAGGITRVMALPGMEDWFQRFLPFLSAAPRPPEE